MQLPSAIRELITSSDLETKQFGVGDPRIIQWILRDKLYRDKLRVVMQEYITNARDAHREAGVAFKPLDVIAPTRLDPRYIIRDYGPGISPDRFDNVFTVYGASTKRGSDLENGGFGIGAKCGFAYTDTFTVVTWHGGVKYTYLCFINDEDTCEATLLGGEPSDEATGTEIQIGIKEEDIARARSILSWVTFFWPTRPNVLPEGSVLYDDSIFRCDQAIRGSNFILTPTNKLNLNLASETKMYVVVDGIPYPLKTDIPFTIPNGFNLYMLFETSEVSIAVTRDGYEEKESNIKAIAARAVEVEAELPALIRGKLEETGGLQSSLISFISGSHFKELKQITEIQGLPIKLCTTTVEYKLDDEGDRIPDEDPKSDQAWVVEKVVGIPMNFVTMYRSHRGMSDWSYKTKISLWDLVKEPERVYYCVGSFSETLKKGYFRNVIHTYQQNTFIVMPDPEEKDPVALRVIEFLDLLEGATDITDDLQALVDSKRKETGERSAPINTFLDVVRSSLVSATLSVGSRTKIKRRLLHKNKVTVATYDGFYRAIRGGAEVEITPSELSRYLTLQYISTGYSDDREIVIVPARREKELGSLFTLYDVDAALARLNPNALWDKHYALTQAEKRSGSAASYEFRHWRDHVFDFLKDQDLLHISLRKGIADIRSDLEDEDPYTLELIRLAVREKWITFEPRPQVEACEQVIDIVTRWYQGTLQRLLITGYRHEASAKRGPATEALLGYLNLHLMPDMVQLAKLSSSEEARVCEARRIKREQKEQEAAAAAQLKQLTGALKTWEARVPPEIPVGPEVVKTAIREFGKRWTIAPKPPIMLPRVTMPNLRISYQPRAKGIA